MNKDVFVKRPNDLIEARFALSAKQNDIIDLLLTKLKDDLKVEYELNINDYLNLYDKDITNIYRDFKKAVNEFVVKNPSFKIYNYTKDSDRTVFFWFVRIDYLKDGSRIRFKLDLEVKDILLQMKNVTYYKIKYTLNFESIYSKRLYLYLKRFDDTGFRIDKLSDLLDKLNCPKSYYDNYSSFKNKVLKAAFKEINHNTDIIFNYKEKKTGRKITHIEFYITKVLQEDEKKQEFLEVSKNEINQEEQNCVKVDNESIENKLIAKLKRNIKEPISEKDLKTILEVAEYDVTLVLEKYKLAKKQGGINNLTAWLIVAVKDNYEVPIEIENQNQKKNRFVNYEQREWNFEELDRMERELIDRDLKRKGIIIGN